MMDHVKHFDLTEEVCCATKQLTADLLMELFATKNIKPFLKRELLLIHPLSISLRAKLLSFQDELNSFSLRKFFRTKEYIRGSLFF